MNIAPPIISLLQDERARLDINRGSDSSAGIRRILALFFLSLEFTAEGLEVKQSIQPASLQ